jgi:hypothetical protein
LLLGSIPGVWVGAHLSARAPDRIVKAVLAVVLSASAFKLLGVPTAAVGWFLVVVAVAGPIAWVLVRAYVRRRTAQLPDLEASAQVTVAHG